MKIEIRLKALHPAQRDLVPHSVLRNVSRQLLWSFLHAHPYYNSEQTSQRYVEVKPGTFARPPDEISWWLLPGPTVVAKPSV